MSDLPIKATLKSGGGYDAPWLTVDASTPDELQQRLRAVIDSQVLETVAEAAGVFRATQLIDAPAPQQQAPAQQAAPQQQQSGGWGQAPQTQQQQRPQGGGGRPNGGPPHPEGKACESCSKVLEFKTTSGGKGTWRCPDWRWNNGNPNGHTQEWA